MGLLDDIAKRLREAKPEEREGFLSQIRKEKTLYDLLRKAGLEPTVSDPQEKAIERPQGLLSKTAREIDTLAAQSLMFNLVQNGSFEDGLQYWKFGGSAQISSAQKFEGSYSCKLGVLDSVRQYIVPVLGSDFALKVCQYHTAPYSDKFLFLGFEDGTFEEVVLDVAPADVNKWLQKEYSPDESNKAHYVLWFEVKHNGAGDIYVDFFRLWGRVNRTVVYNMGDFDLTIKQIFVPFNGKIADITHADTNKHTLDLAAALGETRKIVDIRLMGARIAGTGFFWIYPDEGAQKDFLSSWAQSVDITIKDATQRLQYCLSVAGDDWDLYCFGYVVEG